MSSDPQDATGRTLPARAPVAPAELPRRETPERDSPAEFNHADPRGTFGRIWAAGSDGGN